MPQSRIDRIRQMEEIYDRVRKDIATLREYEESGQWLQDYEADERGELPRDLKRGVLSQDGLDDVFEDAKSLPSPFRKYPVITLCGSTRFKEQFLKAIAYFSKVKGVTAVERDHIYHLIDPVRPKLEVM